MIAGAVVLFGALAASPSAGAGEPRYALADGCHALRSAATGANVIRAGDGYRAAAGQPAAFRLRATALGRYLLFDSGEDFLAAAPLGRVAAADRASEHADWEVHETAGRRFALVDRGDRRALAVSANGDLVTVEPGSAGAAERFEFVPASGCAKFPEAELNAKGRPSRGAAPHGEVRGFADAHTHLMAFEFLGGQAHCGRPWHPWGIAHALVDCPDHQPNGEAAVLENTLADGQPLGRHSPEGWPSFEGWPRWNSLTHEGVYYRWLERAWMGGLRVFVNLLVDNSTLCEVYPLKRNSCNEMESVRLQIQRTRELQDYIDAQHGGPGEGWFRIVDDPFEARRVANQGKLAVVLGIEVSELFDCGIFNEAPECDRAQIDRQLDEFHRLGVRQMELVNKFDNALGGVAGDAGNFGTAINAGNFYETGRFWDMRTCTDEAHDHEQATAPDGARDILVANGLREFLPGGLMPIYPDPPHCNQRGLSALGEHLVRRMIERRMIVDPDHLSVIARRQLLTLLEREGYSGVISSHSWSTPDSLPRIHRLGGVVTPMAKSSTGFVEAWRGLRAIRDPRFLFGLGYGADINGFAKQGPPRGAAVANPVVYPFQSFDGAVTFERQRSGERVYDINADGVAHYGLYPDWIEDLRILAGPEIVADMARGAEAYLQMWERAVGVPGSVSGGAGPGGGATRPRGTSARPAPVTAAACRPLRGRLTRSGLKLVRVGWSANTLLRRAGQPAQRSARVWRWCGSGRRAQVVAVLTPRGRVALVASRARAHRARGIGPGSDARRPRGRASSLGAGLFVRAAGRGAAYVYAVRGGRVRWVAVAAREIAGRRGLLRRYARMAVRGA